MYGPVDGMPLVDMSWAGVFGGTGAAKSVARMFMKSCCGLTSLMSIEPVLSSVVMPLMSPFFVFANWFAPTMPVKKPTPGELMRKRRLIV